VGRWQAFGFRRSNSLNRQDSTLARNDDLGARRACESEIHRALWIYVVTLLVLTAVAWCVVGIRRSILHGADQRTTLLNDQRTTLLDTEKPFTDFTDLSQRVAHFGEPNMLSRTDLIEPYPYPVPTIYAYLFFIRLFSNPLAVYLLFTCSCFFVATLIFSWRVERIAPKLLPQIAIWSTFFLGFPLWMLLDRGNIETVIWIPVLLGVVAYSRNRLVTSAVLWSIAASMKIFPALLFVLFLSKRKYGTFALAIAATAIFTVLALAGVGPTIMQAASDSSKSAAFLNSDFILMRHLPQFDESLFGATKQAVVAYAYIRGNDYHTSSKHTLPALKRALTLYNFAVPLGAVLLYWFRLRRMPLLNQFMTFMILSILLPQVSFEYKLVYIYLAWGAFLLFLLADVAVGRVRIPAKAIYVVLFSCAVVFVPLTYLEFSNKSGEMFGFGGQVKAIFLILILLTVCRVPMPSSLFGDLQLPDPSEART
jgi:Glycosyltransferase family 87